MSATPPPGYTDPPADLPIRGDRSTFSGRVDAWVTWFSTVILAQLAAMIANAYANAVDAFSSAIAAANSASQAALSAATAAAGPGSPMWVSGTTYAAGADVKSPSNLQVYIRQIAGAGTTDPALDPTNWRALLATQYGTFMNVREFTASGTFTVKKTGWHRITATAPPGRGGYSSGPNTSGAGASGSGAGGFCQGVRWLTQGDVVTVLLGAGPTGYTPANNTAVNGADGGNTTVSTSSMANMVAQGGKGGKATLTGGALLGGDGGDSTGGDLNIKGGRGGNIQNCAAGTNTATGGGSVGLQGLGKRGGDISGNGTGNRATGGAGVGGNGGDITTTTSAYSGGGGAGGDAPASTTTTGIGGPNYAGVAGTVGTSAQEAPVGQFATLFNATGGGPSSNGSALTRKGAGGAGVNTGSASANNGGDFSGSGGLTDTLSSGFSFSGNYGGGEGGRSIPNGGPTMPQIPNGYCVIEF